MEEAAICWICRIQHRQLEGEKKKKSTQDSKSDYTQQRIKISRSTPWESLDEKEKKQRSLLSGFKDVYSFIVGHVEHLGSAGCMEANEMEAQKATDEKKGTESK